MYVSGFSSPQTHTQSEFLLLEGHADPEHLRDYCKLGTSLFYWSAVSILNNWIHIERWAVEKGN